MIDRIAPLLRGRARDALKAQDYLATSADREVLAVLEEAGYDDFVGHAREVREPSILLGTATDSAGEAVEVRMGLDQFAIHMVCQGSTGSGKTSFATWLFANALREGLPVGLLDCKAGFFELGLQWAAAVAALLAAPDREAFVRRLAVVNPFGESLVPLNVCRVAPGATPELQAYDVAGVLATLFDSAVGVQMQTLIQHLLLLLTESELTLVEAPIVLQDPIVRGILVERSQNPRVREYFGRYESIPSSSREAVITRLQALTLPENLRLMLGADDLIDFKAIFDRGDPLFLFLGMGAIPADLVDLIGSLVLQRLFDGAKAGSLRSRRPYMLYGDEWFHLIDGIPVLARRFERGLDTLRGFGVHLATVLHRLSQLPRSLQDAILQHCDLVALFRTSSRDAQAFADFLPEVDPDLVRDSLRRHGRPPAKHEIRAQLLERLQRLPDRTCYLYDRRKPYRALRLRVPDLPAPHQAAGMSERQLEAFSEAHGIATGGYAKPKEELRRQIEQRAERLRQLVRPPLEIVRGGEHQAQADADTAPKRRRPRLG